MQTVNGHDAWESLKSTLVTEPALYYFDPRKRTSASTDASKAGLGAALPQEEILRKMKHCKQGIF